MTMVVGMRDLARNSNILDGYDYVDVKDKKTNEYKGLFISPKYADEFKTFLENKVTKKKHDKLDRIMKYAGKGEIYERFNKLTSSQIREKVALEKYDC
jgi:guanylate kinase